MLVESKVFDQLNKVELGSQKIELSIVDDFSKSTNDGNAAAKLLLDAVEVAEKLEASIKELQTKFNSQVGIIKKGYANSDKIDTAQSKLYDKAKAAAGNLGMNIQDIKGYSEWWASVNMVTRAIKVADKYVAM
jgi:hypothetical protein